MPVTIQELKKLCEQEIKLGHGDYTIMVSSDDEGNDFHYLWYHFTPIDEYTENFVDEDIAPKNKTIILG